MRRNRAKARGRRGAGRFAGIPHAVMDHPHYLQLSGNALRLLLELARQYNGGNNGDLTAAWTIMQRRGFNSQTTLNRALTELLELDFVRRTREGRFSNPGKQCALYALTWQAIDECPGKRLDVSPTATPPRAFSAEIIGIMSIGAETGARPLAMPATTTQQPEAVHRKAAQR